MRTLEANVPRRKVIEAYLAYDSQKKKKQRPDITHWNWDDPNFLERMLKVAGFKEDLAGFSLWNRVEISLEDLRDCAVVDLIAHKLNGPRDLRGLEWQLRGWKPDGKNPWFNRVAHGRVFGPREPFILRPRVACESPAKWYIIDGSGRATTMIAYAAQYAGKPIVAHGFLGMLPDQNSGFMKRHYSALLSKARSAFRLEP